MNSFSFQLNPFEWQREEYVDSHMGREEHKKEDQKKLNGENNTKDKKYMYR